MSSATPPHSSRAADGGRTDCERALPSEPKPSRFRHAMDYIASAHRFWSLSTTALGIFWAYAAIFQLSKGCPIQNVPPHLAQAASRCVNISISAQGTLRVTHAKPKLTWIVISGLTAAYLFTFLGSRIARWNLRSPYARSFMDQGAFLVACYAIIAILGEFWPKLFAGELLWNLWFLYLDALLGWASLVVGTVVLDQVLAKKKSLSLGDTQA